jgi:BirA family transcriptional regulator, biotin operon repressor / biotin---[acetyl-CoA-carboxylase] ligase
MNFRILHYNTLPSTNDFAISLAKQGAREGTVVTAKYQTRGRGRFRRRWHSTRGTGLLFSLILRPKVKTSKASLITHLAARSIQEAIERVSSIKSTLKRPNDVLVNQKKVAGILCESSTSGSRVDYVVLGAGLNVNSRKKDLIRGATSLFEESHKKYKPEDLLDEFLRLFKINYKNLPK